MADEKPTIHIDADWKKQAQEEKRRLAEQEQQRAAKPAAPPAGSPAAGRGRGMAAGRGGRGEAGPADFSSLVQSLATQMLFYLGELAPRGGEAGLNLDMAKHLLDTLGMLEEKTRGNLTEEEKRVLDATLYESRMRFVNVASQFIGP